MLSSRRTRESALAERGHRSRDVSAPECLAVSGASAISAYISQSNIYCSAVFRDGAPTRRVMRKRASRDVPSEREFWCFRPHSVMSSRRCDSHGTPVALHPHVRHRRASLGQRARSTCLAVTVTDHGIVPDRDKAGPHTAPVEVSYQTRDIAFHARQTLSEARHAGAALHLVTHRQIIAEADIEPRRPVHIWIRNAFHA